MLTGKDLLRMGIAQPQSAVCCTQRYADVVLVVTLESSVTPGYLTGPL
jgi:hypothetical protein